MNILKHNFSIQEVLKSRKAIYLFVLLTAFMLTLQTSSAQQLPQYTQFNINPYIINPAIAGTEDFTYLQASYRSQWSGFEGAPKTGYLTGHTTIGKRTVGYSQKKFSMERWFSLGGLFSYDETGPIKQTSGYATFAYNMPLSKNGLRISVGMNAGVKSFSYNPEGFIDNVADQNDPFITTGNNNTVFDLGLGVWLYSKRVFFGATSLQLLENDLNTQFSLNDPLVSGSLIRHYYIMAGYKVNIHKDLYLVPSVLIKSLSDYQISFDINSKLVYRGAYWLGVNYRNEDSLSAFAGLLINDRLEVSYSYDLITSPIRNSASGSSEILIGFRINKDSKILCPDEFW